MEHLSGYGLADASEDLQRQTAEAIVDAALRTVRPRLVGAVRTFMDNPISATAFFALELALLGLTREIGRLLVESVVNALEPASPEQLPRDAWFQSSGYDRAGKRLTTVYLAWPPELGQATMDRLLTELLQALFHPWEGPLPRLAYVADSGSNENGYYERILRRMVHPRTGKPLSWQRVVDYYHVSERVWAMATALFGNGTREGNAWAHRMLKALKQPSGASRVLHSAASLYHRRQPPNARSADFWKAYRYIQKRTRYLRYSEYASHHIPLGSGVTEAACKTIFTQRLKLSGMRWSFNGAQTILSLRVILLSGTWSSTYAAHLVNLHPRDLRPYAANRDIHLTNAA